METFRVRIIKNSFASNNLLFKFLTSHASILMNVFIIEILRKDTGILSDSLSSIDVVAGAHADSDAGRVTLGNGLSDSWA